MQNKRSVSKGNRVFMANLGAAGSFTLRCGHRELKQIESLLNVKMSEINLDSVRTIDCCLYCMVQHSAAEKGVALDKAAFEDALDKMNPSLYWANARAVGDCFAAAFDVPGDAADDGEPDEKNAPTPPQNGTGTEVW